MQDDYVLKYFSVDGVEFSELVKSDCKYGRIQEQLSNRKTSEKAKKLITHIKKIHQYGIEVSCKTDKLRCLDSSHDLYEIKGYWGAMREMCLIRCDSRLNITLLFEFRGHRGKSSNIQEHIDRGVRLAKIVQEIIDD